MSEWKELKIGDILHLITKGTTPSKGVGFVEKGINYIKSESISYDWGMKLEIKKFRKTVEIRSNRDMMISVSVPLLNKEEVLNLITKAEI